MRGCIAIASPHPTASSDVLPLRTVLVSAAKGFISDLVTQIPHPYVISCTFYCSLGREIAAANAWFACGRSPLIDKLGCERLCICD